MTDRERHVFLLRMSGRTTREIGVELGVSTSRAGQIAAAGDLKIEQAARASEWRLHPEWSAAREVRVRQTLATWQDLAWVEPRVTWWQSYSSRAAWWQSYSSRAAWPQLAVPRAGALCRPGRRLSGLPA